jgi:hypothetical protein
MTSIPQFGKVSDLLSWGYVMAAGRLPAMVYDHHSQHLGALR